MTQKELIKKIAENTGQSINAVEKVLSTLYEEMALAMVRGEVLQIPKFGGFKVVERKERQGRNPQTGEEITIPAYKTVKFTISKKLKERLN